MIIKITADEYREADNECCGYCVSCGEQQSGCEPDARKYTCESCGRRTVYGAAELLLMGGMEITDGEEDSE